VHERAVSGTESGPGIFGKLPARGDFISRRMPGDMSERLHALLLETLTAGRRSHGEAWLNAYLTAPIWRFAATGRCLGRSAVVGLIMPSVDQVGRHFPVVVLYRLSGDAGAAALLAEAGDWLDALNEELDIDALESGLAALPPPEPTRFEPPGAGAQAGQELPWRIDLGAEPEGPGVAAYAELADRALRQGVGAYSVWSTAGSDQVPPELCVLAGLPDPACLVSFFAGTPAPAAAPLPLPSTESLS